MIKLEIELAQTNMNDKLPVNNIFATVNNLDSLQNYVGFLTSIQKTMPFVIPDKQLLLAKACEAIKDLLTLHNISMHEDSLHYSYVYFSYVIDNDITLFSSPPVTSYSMFNNVTLKNNIYSVYTHPKPRINFTNVYKCFLSNDSIVSLIDYRTNNAIKYSETLEEIRIKNRLYNFKSVYEDISEQFGTNCINAINVVTAQNLLQFKTLLDY